MIVENEISKADRCSLPEGWIETTLDSISNIEMGQSPKSEYYNLEGTGLPFYQGVTEFNSKYVDIKTFTSKSTKIVEENTILFSVRAPVGRVNFTKQRCCIGRGNAGLFMKNNNQDFLYFLLKFIERELQDYTSGTIFSSISGKELRKMFVMIPKSEVEQKAIANILTSLDDKIELLQEQNQTLETIAQTIFKEWFGKYQIGDELPEGWKVGKLSDILEIKYGKDHKHLNDGVFPLYGSGGIMRYVEKPLYDKESILIPRKGTLTNLFYLNKPFWSVDTMFFSKIKYSFQGRFTYLFLKSLNLSAMDVGSAVPSLTTQVLNEIPVIIPEDNFMIKFNDVVSSFYTKMNANNSQIETLTKTRDVLLPKLMSGEIRVKYK